MTVTPLGAADDFNGSRHVPETAGADRIALAVRQPWAELIVRGVKTIEGRSTACRARGRVYVYASRKASDLPGAAEAAARFGLDVAALPNGMIVGAVDLTGCRPAVAGDASAAHVRPSLLADRFAWMLAGAERFAKPLPVRVPPYGVWFYPFRRRADSEITRGRR